MERLVRRVIAGYPEFFLAWLCYRNANGVLAGESVDGYIVGIIAIELLGFVWLKFVLSKDDGSLVDQSLIGLGSAAFNLVAIVLLGSFAVLAVFALLLVDVPLLVFLLAGLSRRQLWFWSWRINEVRDRTELHALYRRSRRVHLLALILACLTSALMFWLMGRPQAFESVSDALSLAGMAGYFSALGIYLLAGRQPQVSDSKAREPVQAPKEIALPELLMFLRLYRERWFMLVPWVGFAWLVLILIQRVVADGLFIAMLPLFGVISCLPLLAATVDVMGYHIRSPLAFAWRRRGAVIYAAVALWLSVVVLLTLSVPFFAGLLGLPLDDELSGSGQFLAAMMVPLCVVFLLIIRFWPIVVLPFLVDDEQVPDGELMSQCKLAWAMTAGVDGVLRGGAAPFVIVGPIMLLALLPSPYFWMGQIAIFGCLLPLLAICVIERCLVMAKARTEFPVFGESGVREDAYSAPDVIEPDIGVPIPVPLPIPASAPDKTVSDVVLDDLSARSGSYTYSSSQSDEEIIFEAAMNGDLATVKQKLAAGVRIESTFRDLTLLVHAAYYGQKDIVRLLLERGANPLAREPLLNSSLLHLVAPIEGAADLAAALVTEHGLNIEDVDSNGSTALFNAIAAGQVDTALRLLALGANPLHLNNRMESTLTFFVSSYRVRKNFIEPPAVRQLMTELIRQGVDPHHANDYGGTAVHIAASSGPVELLQHFSELGVALDLPDPAGVMPMQAAAAAGQLEVIEYLRAGEPLQDLHTAVRLGDVDAVRSILEADPDKVNGVIAEEGSYVSLEPPIYLAIENGDKPMTNLLLDHGADPCISSRRFGGSMFHLAKHLDDYDTAVRMLDAGADRECPDGDSNTALNMAARYDNLPVAMALLEAGADPNAETERGYRVLAWAKGEAMQNLLKHYGGIYTGGPY